jgi:hypothetical protein
MDPAYVYQFAKTEGFYHYNCPTSELSDIDRLSILEVFEKLRKDFLPRSRLQKEYQDFVPLVSAFRAWLISFSTDSTPRIMDNSSKN